MTRTLEREILQTLYHRIIFPLNYKAVSDMPTQQRY